MLPVPRGSSSVAVPAADLADVDLAHNRLQAVLEPRQVGDRGTLRTKMVELEHERIAQPAVDARRALEKIDHIAQVTGAPGSQPGDVLDRSGHA